MKRRALVTGASRGIGAAIAEALAAMGHPVILNFHSNRAAAETVRDRIVAAGGSATLEPFDVADAQASRACLERLLSEPEPIGIVVNNAGVVDDAVFPSMTRVQWDRVTRTTLDGFFNVTQPLVMPMVRARWGRIINIASVSGVTGQRGQVNYSAAKAGLIGATRSLAQEVARRGVTVNAIAPGLIDTDMIAGAPIDEIVAHVPMRRVGTVAEVAATAAFLASEGASYITGEVINVNGGLA